MTTYYVSDTGSNTNDGLSPSTAFLTIDYAIGQVSAGSIILVDGSFTVTSTIFVNKSLTLTTNSYAIVTKTTVGDLFLIQSSNVTISLLELTQTTSNLADFLINIDRGSTGFNPPANYSNVRIEGCTLNMWKYGICLNGSDCVITLTSFQRQSGTTERLTCIIIYYVNGCEISACTVTDSLRMQRFIYLSSSGTAGSPYLNDINTKNGLINVMNNSSSCTSTVQGLQFIIQDSFIGSSLSYSVNGNQINDSVVATKLFIAYINTGTDLDTLTNVSVFNNYQSLTQTGAVLIDSAASVTVPLTQKFNTYDNTGNFTLRADYTGNINFTQQTANVLPSNLASSGIVVYAASGGGDPHIIDIHGIKTTLPNDWYEFILYKSDTYIVTAKAQFIGNWLLGNTLHYIRDGTIKEIDIYKDTWVTNFTYITEVTITKDYLEEPSSIIIDTIYGKIIKNSRNLIYSTCDECLKSVTHEVLYPPIKLKSYEINLEPDIIRISVDNYWDDINIVTLYPREAIGDKVGELITHSDSNKLN